MSENIDSPEEPCGDTADAVEATEVAIVDVTEVAVDTAVDTDAVKSEEPKQTAKQKHAPAKVAAAPVASRYAVVGGGETDAVMLSRCVFKNPAARKSLTVHHLQRRLTELGYREADADKDGWYGDLTRNAVAAFQRDRKLDGDGLMTEQTLLAIFNGDLNVTVVID